MVARTRGPPRGSGLPWPRRGGPGVRVAAVVWRAALVVAGVSLVWAGAAREGPGVLVVVIGAAAALVGAVGLLALVVVPRSRR
ncbi:hypothetical protein FTX61_16495 [Nitriliruptoraceae bacterium ZYF776]|nr:hypothetical protein [Profundirhabdus halotolerans]